MYSPITICFILSLCVFAPRCAHAQDLPAWPTARQTVLHCYGGWDVEVSVSSGYERREFDSGPVDGPFANGTITVPLYSKKQRIEQKEQTNRQLEHLAELYAEHQGQSAIIEALEGEKQVLKRTMLDDGANGISAYYGLIKDVEQAKAKRDSARRKIVTWLDLCGMKNDVAANGTPGAGSSAQ